MTDEALKAAEAIAREWVRGFINSPDRFDAMAAIILDLVKSHRAITARLAAVEAERDQLRAHNELLMDTVVELSIDRGAECDAHAREFVKRMRDQTPLPTAPEPTT